MPRRSIWTARQRAVLFDPPTDGAARRARLQAHGCYSRAGQTLSVDGEGSRVYNNGSDRTAAEAA